MNLKSLHSTMTKTDTFSWHTTLETITTECWKTIHLSIQTYKSHVPKCGLPIPTTKQMMCEIWSLYKISGNQTQTILDSTSLPVALSINRPDHSRTTLTTISTPLVLTDKVNQF